MRPLLEIALTLSLAALCAMVSTRCSHAADQPCERAKIETLCIGVFE